MNFVFIVKGKAVSQSRPLFVGGSKKRAVDRAPSRKYKQLVRQTVLAGLRNNYSLGLEDCPIFSHGVVLDVTEYRVIPASWPKWRKLRAANGLELPISRPDGDNILKGIQDALQGIFWRDDAEVIRSTITKVYAWEPYVTICVKDALEGRESAKRVQV